MKGLFRNFTDGHLSYKVGLFLPLQPGQMVALGFNSLREFENIGGSI